MKRMVIKPIRLYIQAVKKIYAIGIILLLYLPSYAQQSTVTKPWARWWWHGSAINKKDISKLLKEYKAKGIGGLEITPIFGVKGTEKQFVDYLSPKWIDLLQHTLNEAEKNGIAIDMATGTGWPFGGPWIDESAASKYFTFKKYKLLNGKTLTESISYQPDGFVRTANGVALQTNQVKYPLSSNTDFQSMALDQIRYSKPLEILHAIAYYSDGKFEEITSHVTNNFLNWKASQDADIIVLYSGLHGKMVERAAPGGEGYVIDHFDSTALKTYLDKFDKALSPTSIKSLRGFFNDSYEVDDARGQSNFTPRFFEEFILKRGYDLKSVLPILLDTTQGDIHKRVLHDYRMTISDLLLDQFTSKWVTWGHTKNKIIRNQAHGAPSNILDLYNAVDIPETEGDDILRYKFATSTAHVMGKKLASAEAATWLNEHFLYTTEDIKNCVDKFFLGGVNHIVYHGIAYSPIKASFPGWLFYASVHLTPHDPQWNVFTKLNNYISQCQTILQKGEPERKVLLYFPYSDKNHQPGRDLLHHIDGMLGFDKTNFKEVAETLEQSQIPFDFISDRQVEFLESNNSKLKAPGGDYEVLIIPKMEFIPLTTLQKINGLAQAGTKIIFIDWPKKTSGYLHYEKNELILADIISSWYTERRHVPIRESNVLNALRMHGVSISALGVNDKLSYTKRIDSDNEYWFVKNISADSFSDFVTISTTKTTISIYDPMKNIFSKPELSTSGNQRKIRIRLAPGETVFMTCSNDAIQNGVINTTHSLTHEMVVIDSIWTLKFIQGGPTLPKEKSIVSLASWTTFGKEYESFSGAGIYTNTFTINNRSNDYVLDLGEVNESAIIKVNGRAIDTLIAKPFQTVIPKQILKAKNTLEIIVYNSMANRITYMDKNNIPWKKFYNVNMPARFATNRGQDGLFTAAQWNYKASGLVGPVRLYRL